MKTTSKLLIISVFTAVAATAVIAYPLFAQPRDVIRNINYVRLARQQASSDRFYAVFGAWKRGEVGPDAVLQAAKQYHAEGGVGGFLDEPIAEAYLAKGDKAKAREYYAKVVRPGSGSSSTSDPTVLSQYAMLCLEAGDVAEAEVYLAKIDGEMVADKYLTAAKTAEARQDFKLATTLYRAAKARDVGDGTADRALKRIEAGKGGYPEG